MKTLKRKRVKKMKKVIEYIIRTEDKDRYKIQNILAQFDITGYTLLETIGCWKGIIEQGLAIQIIDSGTDKLDPVIIQCIAEEIKVQNNQEFLFVEKRELELNIV
jgi:hypothetical protein